MSDQTKIVRYKVGFDYEKGQIGVLSCEFAKETESRLYYPPKPRGVAWTNKTEWPHSTYEAALEAGIEFKLARIERLEQSLASTRADLEKLRALAIPSTVL